MSKRQAVSVAEIAELEALGIVPETPAEPAPKRELTTKVHPNGWTQRECYCEKHGEYYDVFAPPRLAEVLIGADGCRQCKEYAKQLADADAWLSSSEEAEKTRAEAAQDMLTCEAEIQEKTDELTEAYLKEQRPEIRAFYENETRSAYFAQIRADIEDRKRSEYMAKAGGDTKAVIEKYWVAYGPEASQGQA